MPPKRKAATAALQDGGSTANNSSSSAKKQKMGKGGPKYYAVAKGRETGVFMTWNECEGQITGFTGAKFKSFKTEAEAVKFIEENGSKEAVDRAKGKAGSSDTAAITHSESAATTTAPKDKTIKSKPVYVDTDDSVLKIWTDGSSRGNGKVGARAGLGVYFGPSDPRNISQRVPGSLQTNNRGELLAIQRALEAVPKTQDVQIISDSDYSIKCVVQWGENWRKKGWKKSGGEAVKNPDLIEDCLDLIEGRREVGARTDFTWVKGHDKDEGNEAADKLAVAGAYLPEV